MIAIDEEVISMLLIEQLTTQENFTSNEQKIAHYILENLTQIPNMNIEQIAKQTYTSHSAVVRLAKKLNFEGFRDFKIALSEAAYNKRYTQEQVDANFPFEPQDSSDQIAKKMADLTIETIKLTQLQINGKLLEDAAAILTKANRIFLFAKGDSQIRARSFQNKMIKINKFLIVADEYADEAWTAANLTPTDCALFVTYGAKSPQHAKILTYFQEKRIPSVLLSGNPNAALNQLATLPIIISQNEYDFLKIGTFSSQVAFQYVLDTLFSILYAQEFQQNLVNLKIKHALLEQGILSENPTP